jgi:hypothetical protein
LSDIYYDTVSGGELVGRGKVITEQIDLKRECLPEEGASPGGEREEKRINNHVRGTLIIVIIFYV